MPAAPRSLSEAWPPSAPKARSPLRPELLEGPRDREGGEEHLVAQGCLLGVLRRTTPRRELARARREQEGDRVVVHQGVAVVGAMLVVVNALRREAIVRTARGMVVIVAVIMAAALVVAIGEEGVLARPARRFQVSFLGVREGGLAGTSLCRLVIQRLAVCVVVE